MQQTKIIFICLGNICRSPMAEFLFKDMLEKSGYKAIISSKATSDWEIGNPVYPPAKKLLEKLGIDCSRKRAEKLTKSDCDEADYLIVMDESNLRDTRAIAGKANYEKVKMLLSFTSFPRAIADPWYTGDFNATYDDLMKGLNAFKDYLVKENRI